jgi:hypothetical protein
MFGKKSHFASKNTIFAKSDSAKKIILVSYPKKSEFAKIFFPNYLCATNADFCENSNFCKNANFAKNTNFSKTPILSIFHEKRRFSQKHRFLQKH